MKKNYPAIFFAVACLLNWAGRIWEPSLAAAVKPALLPLLALAVLWYALSHRVNKRQLTLLILAELFGCVGDTCLLSDAFPLFAGGIGAFLIGHIFYITLFGGISWKGLSWKAWVPGVLVMGGLVFGLVKLLRISGALLAPMAIYGSVLMLLIFSTFCGLVREKDKCTWSVLFCGALLFTFSDSLIAAGTFHVVEFALQEFVIMFTYLVAQTLLAVGGLRLAKAGA
ncbi:MAG: lysoplasmalogenase [Bacteroidales bacterium]|nr:lysoplasmalogenase [Bacteroidales bacterium]